MSDTPLDVADALLTVGRAEAARKRVAQVLAGAPEHPRALRLLARCHQETGDYPAMLAAADAAVAAAPDEPSGHLLRGSALLQLGRGSEAVQAADATLRLAPNAWSAYLLRGLALVDVPGRRRGAFADLRQAIRLAPHEPQPNYVLGTLHHALGNRRKARQAYRRTLRLDPQHAGAQRGLGHLALRAGRATAAARYFSAAAAAEPDARGAVGRVERVLVGAAGWGLMTAFVVALALVFTAVPLAWAVAAAVAGLYALWCARFWRALATGTRELARQRLRRDPRLRVRLGCAGALLLAGLAAGAYRAPGAGQRLALVAVLLLLLVAAGVAAVVVDARTARIHDEAGPEEHGEARIGPLLLRWYVAAGLAAVVPCMLAMDRVGWILRAATGTACIAALVGYLRWSAVRWRYRPRPVLPLGLLGLSRGASAATGLLAVYLPAAAYLPARAADVLSAPALVLIAGALLGAVVWSLVATARRLRRGWTSRAPSARRPAA